MFWSFVFFLDRGFWGILYELVWRRLAVAQFGVTTAQVSIVLSAFTGGLGLGSLGSGLLARQYGHKIHFPGLRFYAASGLAIAAAPEAPPLAADRPINQYFLLRNPSFTRSSQTADP